MTDLRRLKSDAPGFRAQLDQLLAWESVSDDHVFKAVMEILHAVKTKGDDAVIEYTNRFDRMSVGSMSDLEIPAEELQAALTRIPEAQRVALEQAAEAHAYVDSGHKRGNVLLTIES